MLFALLLTFFFLPGMWSQWLALQWPYWDPEVTLIMNAERLNIQMDHGQTLYKNKTLTHSLQPPAQEASPLSPVTSPGSQLLSVSCVGSQTAISGDQFRSQMMTPVTRDQEGHP